MIAAKQQCSTCPWGEPGAREDMIKLLELGERRWPCHDTAAFSTDSAGFVVDLIEASRNRICFGYLRFQREKKQAAIAALENHR